VEFICQDLLPFLRKGQPLSERSIQFGAAGNLITGTALFFAKILEKGVESLTTAV
jgi:hypothetical protein